MVVKMNNPRNTNRLTTFIDSEMGIVFGEARANIEHLQTEVK
jgi:hypothetical protein